MWDTGARNGGVRTLGDGVLLLGRLHGVDAVGMRGGAGPRAGCVTHDAEGGPLQEEEEGKEVKKRDEETSVPPLYQTPGEPLVRSQSDPSTLG